MSIYDKLTTRDVSISVTWNSINGSNPMEPKDTIGIKFNCKDKEIISRTIFINASDVTGLEDYNKMNLIILEMINNGKIS